MALLRLCGSVVDRMLGEDGLDVRAHSGDEQAEEAGCCWVSYSAVVNLTHSCHIFWHIGYRTGDCFCSGRSLDVHAVRVARGSGMQTLVVAIVFFQSIFNERDAKNRFCTKHACV